MACNPEVLKKVPLFALLDAEETAVLAGQVELKKFAPRERIWKIGDSGGQAYVTVSGAVRVTTVDEDHQEVVVDEPAEGEFFGFASMLEQTPHQTSANALEEPACLEVSRDDIAVLLQRKRLGEGRRHRGRDLSGAAGRNGSSHYLGSSHSNWYGCAPAATPTRSSKSKPRSANGSLITLHTRFVSPSRTLEVGMIGRPV